VHLLLAMQKSGAILLWSCSFYITSTNGSQVTNKPTQLFIHYFVVPWSYYESARARRIMFNNHSKKRQLVAEELRRHELIGLIWVVLSPGIAGYTLQYSRYVLSNHDKYMSTFNVTVFVLAASIKPIIHIIALLTERTLFLQSEALVDESDIEILQKKVEIMEDELDGLRQAFATKRDLGQVPTKQKKMFLISRFIR
jgi:hypothetical protein